MLANCSFLWFDCKHVNGIIFPCYMHVSSHLDNDALCVATKMLNNLPFRCFVCNHNSIKNMYCHASFQESRLVVATNIRTTCSFIWFVCKHVTLSSAWDTHIPMIFAIDDLCVTSNMLNNFSFQWLVCTPNDVSLDILPCVFLPNSPVLASKMLFEIWIQCFECPTTTLYGVFEFPHLDNVQTISMHIGHAYASHLLYLSCANRVVNKNGHATNDMLLYHTQTYVAWSLLYEGTNAYTSTSMDYMLTRRPEESYLWLPFIELSLQAKVTSFYLRTHAIMFMNWLCFECCFAFVVSFIGFMEGEGTLKCFQVNLPKDDYMVNPRITDFLRPLRLRDEHGESRMTIFEGGR